MGIQLLGPVEVRAGTTRVDVGTPRQAAVVAALAVDAGRLVPVDVLVDRVWGEDPPARVRRILHTYIARVRRMVERLAAAGDGPVRLVRQGSGYLLEVDPDRVDTHRFRWLVEQARDRQCAEERRLALLREAIRLWHGTPLAGLTGDWAERMRESWRQQYVAAIVAWGDAELRAGDAAAVLAPMTELTGECPLVEPLTGTLMRALAAVGRSAEALDRYADLQHRLAGELGIDPGPELQAVHSAILRGELPAPPPEPGRRAAPAASADAPAPAAAAGRPAAGQAAGEPSAIDRAAGDLLVAVGHPEAADGVAAVDLSPQVDGPSTVAGAVAGAVPADEPDDPPGGSSLAAAPSEVAEAVPPRPVPAQLPADVAAFTGRRAELAELDALLAGAGAGAGAGTGGPGGGSVPAVAAVVISAVSGTAGVGKTTLAVHWAHRVAGRFPDGQLYVNLRGFDPGGTVVPPAEAIRGFLDALGVPAERIPPTLDAQAALYRSLLAGKRMLVVLDNARDPEQARPLLPGTPGCLVVVTSRSQLTGLVATEGARLLTLDLLTPAEARDLLVRRLGPARVVAEPGAVEQIIDRCARLPLALTIAAARSATHPTFPLSTMAAELAEAAGRLDALSAGDSASEVRAVFSWSYAALTPAGATLFRLLGLHPGPDISVAAAAGLAGWPRAEVRPLLAELTRASLLTEQVPGRYARHDLLRAYAADLARRQDTDGTRQAAVTRLLDHYLHTASAAEWLINMHQGPITLPLGECVPGAGAEQLADHREAMAWLAAEHQVLLAAVGQAAGCGMDTHAWQLAWAVSTFLDRRGHWADLAAVWGVGVRAADRLGNLSAQSQAHRRLAIAHMLLGRYPQAHAQYQRALTLCAEVGDHVGQALTHHSIAYLCGREGRTERALEHTKQALALFRTAGHLLGQAHSLNQIGWYHGVLGDYRQTLAHCRQALALHAKTGDQSGAAATWDSLGYAHHHLGDCDRAVECYQHALTLYRDSGDRYNEATTLTNLGQAHQAAGDLDAARVAWQRAQAILVALRHPDADAVRARLRHLDAVPAAAGEGGGRSRTPVG